MAVMARISDVQRFSVHDGPGIRTVVFFKGCPLRCLWCQNPETQSTEKQLALYPDHCIGCGGCLYACSHGAVDIAFSTDRAQCAVCGACAVCVADARKIIGEDWELADLAALCMRDRAFYERTGGGVTLGGGEPLAQAGAAAALLALLKQEGLHTAVETSGYSSKADFAALCENTDLFLFDLKVMDAKKHERFCGKPNGPILANLDVAAKAGKEIVIRIPLVPGINDDGENLRATARAALRARAAEVHILPFHQAGRSKWKSIGMRYALGEAGSPGEESLLLAKRVFANEGLPVSIGGGGK
ncbi:MAG: glycyl-radical enzyme activating protein [Clostridiales Family XIII bacterium]|jgi:pyruvate formate lyase activating enzyme|nr:glycyl-radical enzyme activating protein [Clostridiales Family XIII bacterium]